MSIDISLFDIVQKNYQLFSEQLMDVNQNLSTNSFSVHLNLYQSSFLKTVIKLIQKPLLWRKNEVLAVKYQDEQLVFANVLFPPTNAFQSIQTLTEFEQKKVTVHHNPDLVTFLKSQPPELTHVINLFSLLSAWQKAYEMSVVYRNVIDETSALYNLLPVGTLDNDIRFLLHSKCRLSVYNLFMVLDKAKKSGRQDIITFVNQALASDEMKADVNSKNWDKVQVTIEGIVTHFKPK